MQDTTQPSISFLLCFVLLQETWDTSNACGRCSDANVLASFSLWLVHHWHCCQQQAARYHHVCFSSHFFSPAKQHNPSAYQIIHHGLWLFNYLMESLLYVLLHGSTHDSWKHTAFFVLNKFLNFGTFIQKDNGRYGTNSLNIFKPQHVTGIRKSFFGSTIHQTAPTIRLHFSVSCSLQLKQTPTDFHQGPDSVRPSFFRVILRQ